MKKNKFSYNRLKIIKQLRILQNKISKGISIDWLSEREFFRNVEDLAGQANTYEMPKDLEDNDVLINQGYAQMAPENRNENMSEKRPNNNGDNNRQNRDSEYINKYLY